MSNGVFYYINKSGDRKIGKPEHIELYAKIGYAPENMDAVSTDSDNDGLIDGSEELEALRDKAAALGIEWDGRWKEKRLNTEIEKVEAE